MGCRDGDTDGVERWGVVMADVPLGHKEMKQCEK